jgi:hypothetical protein
VTGLSLLKGPCFHIVADAAGTHSHVMRLAMIKMMMICIACV